MSRKKTFLIAASLLAGVGALAAVSAQGHRNQWRDRSNLGSEGFGGPGPGGFGGRFGGPLSKDEFDARSRERFARLDKNSDGVIDAAEIEASMTERLGLWQRMRGMAGRSPGGQRGGPGGERGGPAGGAPDAQTGSQMGGPLLRMFDTDKDGKVTKDEFMAGVRKRFAEMDLNNDGRITDEDLPPMLRGRNIIAGGQIAGDQAPGAGAGRMGPGMPMLRMLQEADANKDGIVTLDEALAAAEKRFATLDRNKDGVIDKADFDALRKEMVDYRVKRFIHHYGADKDGKVTREQFMAKVAERFAMLDRDNDGTLSRDERPGGGWSGRGRGGRGDREQAPGANPEPSKN